MATYWNEIEWIHASLGQIDLINPKKVIICDGCFDPNIENKSTDGTSGIINEYCKDNNKAIKIKAVRKSKMKHVIDWLNYCRNSQVSFIPKVVGLSRMLRTNIYRLNQMATFQYMLTEFSDLKDGDWFMTYDCDQFYSDEIINSIKNINRYEDVNILTSKENTFFESFDLFTDEYEKRDYNNMPHRFLNGLRFIPTRHPARIFNNKYTNCSDFEKKKKYIGEVFHYHIKSPERESAGYSLGDRKPPSDERKKTRKYHGDHPGIIKEFFDSSNKK